MAGDGERCAHHADPILVSAKGRHLVVDIHCHIGCPAASAMVAAAMPDRPTTLPFTSEASSRVNARMFAQIAPALNGVDIRLAEMDHMGVDVQAISPFPGLYFYFTDPELGRDTSRTINDTLAQAVASHPDRFVGIGTVPLQSPEFAIAEMRRCVSGLGMRGIEIGTNVNGRELSDPAFRPFFAAAEELGILLFMHPLGFSHGERLTDHLLNVTIGTPFESTVALGHLILGGVLERHPGLKLCVAHGGGFMPAYWGRLDKAFRVREDSRENITAPPSSYLRRVWLDTMVFDEDQLDFLVRTHGADRLCMGTDYPFDVGETDPVGFHDRLDEADRAKVLGGNAALLLGLAVR